MNARILAALLSTGFLPAPAAAANVTYMSFTAGTFHMPGFLPEPIAMAGSPGQNLIGAYTSLGEQFQFNGYPALYYTGDGSMAPYGGIPVAGGPAVSATVDKSLGTLTVDLSSFTVHWGGNNFNQGDASITGSWDPQTGVYHIGWSHTLISQTFNPPTYHYTMTGIAAVPEPAAAALMLAALGLIGLAVQRRHKNGASRTRVSARRH